MVSVGFKDYTCRWPHLYALDRWITYIRTHMDALISSLTHCNAEWMACILEQWITDFRTMTQLEAGLSRIVVHRRRICNTNSMAQNCDQSNGNQRLSSGALRYDLRVCSVRIFTQNWAVWRTSGFDWGSATFLKRSEAASPESPDRQSLRQGRSESRTR